MLQNLFIYRVGISSPRGLILIGRVGWPLLRGPWKNFRLRVIRSRVVEEIDTVVDLPGPAGLLAEGLKREKIPIKFLS